MRVADMAEKRSIVLIDQIEPLIRDFRDQKVILDNDLAALYEVPTKRLNEQVRRNRERFPADFMFQLTHEEAESLRSQNANLKAGRGQHRKYSPYAFVGRLEQDF
jgi:ORF6N domain